MYCSRQCQLSSWNTHKKYCNALKARSKRLPAAALLKASSKQQQQQQLANSAASQKRLALGVPAAEPRSAADGTPLQGPGLFVTHLMEKSVQELETLPKASPELMGADWRGKPRRAHLRSIQCRCVGEGALGCTRCLWKRSARANAVVGVSSARRETGCGG